MLSQSLLAEDIFETSYSFKDISLNYQNWTKKTQNITSKTDFAYVELEGGAGFSWGKVYFFFDIANPLKSYNAPKGENLSFSFKPVVTIGLVDNLNMHIQSFNLLSDDFHTSNLIVGLSYTFLTDFGFWIEPFAGFNYQKSTYYSGYNGYKVGWVFNYNFKTFDEKFSLTQWHEFSLDRDEEDGYNDTLGAQGALSFWWHPTEKITTGIQYRYAYYELGSNEYQDSFIYSLKYNF